MPIPAVFNERVARRDFLKKACSFLLALGTFVGWYAFIAKCARATMKAPPSREALFYTCQEGKRVQCAVCFRQCVIREGERGFCRNKENRNGRLYSLVHSRPSAVHVDPIEKEPALHMLPGTEILCFGTAGCNLRCTFCHNWHLSQRSIEEMSHTYDLTPEGAVSLALKKKVPTISFTYNEPTSFYEYVYDTAKIAKAKGLRVLVHTNGTLADEPLKELLKYTDAVTVDLKGFTEAFYREASSARLEPVLQALKTIKKSGTWLEIVHLTIPSMNDDPQDLTRMCLWIRDTLGSDVPLHFSRFFPAYKLTAVPPTPIRTLEEAHKIAKNAGLAYVTIGNVPGHDRNSTFCPSCGKRLIHRTHFQVLQNDLVNGRCRFCGRDIPGIWT
jgi:pyruvate formate lyase activating enzyme